ncbi:metal-binding protein [Comamonas phosphati]|nr:metal-binding protein [Comamonas phosphati]
MNPAALLRHERPVIVCGIVALVALSWVYLWQGAGMGMTALDMTALGLFPHRQPAVAGSMEANWWIVASMWWIMMIAMMTPSATPLVLLYSKVLERQPGSLAGRYAAASLLMLGYLVVWLGFAVLAATLQKMLEPSGLISAMMLWSRSAALSAGVLAAAGLYQFSGAKRACLTQCRSPVHFLTRYARPGIGAGFMLGMRHGAFCVGCCWLLMALLFVGGIMNLIWIAALMLFVLVEKLMPAGAAFGKVSGALLLLWAGATLVV